MSFDLGLLPHGYAADLTGTNMFPRGDVIEEHMAPARPDQNSLIGASHGARRRTIQALRRSGVRLEISSVLSAASVEYS
jgi:hypothetical protein